MSTVLVLHSVELYALRRGEVLASVREKVDQALRCDFPEAEGPLEIWLTQKGDGDGLQVAAIACETPEAAAIMWEKFWRQCVLGEVTPDPRKARRKVAS